MKFIILIICLSCLSCGTATMITESSTSTKQVFIPSQEAGLPGKCYSKMKLNNELKWAEIICENEISKSLINTVQSNLQRLGYKISQDEISKHVIGSETKAAIKNFQISNKMAYGALDWATVNRLKIQ